MLIVSHQANLFAQGPTGQSEPPIQKSVATQQPDLAKQLADAKSAFETAAAANKGVHAPTAQALVIAYLNNGMGAEALAFAEEQQSLSIKEFGLASDEAIYACSDLASTTARQKGPEAGVSVFQSFVQRRSKELGEYHPATFRARGGMAGFLTAIGKQKDSFEYQQATIDIYNAKFGDDSIQSMVATNQLADSYFEANEYEKALSLYESTFPKLVATGKPESQLADHSALNMATMYRKINPEKAIEKLEFYWDRFLIVTKPFEKTDRVKSRKLELQSMLGDLYFRSGNFDKAEEIYESLATAAWKEDQRMDQQIQAKIFLAMIMQRRKQPEAAAAKIKAVIAESTEKLGKLHPTTQMSQRVLYEIYSQQSAADQGEKRKLATALFETFSADMDRLKPRGVGPAGEFSMISANADGVLLFAKEDGQAKVVGTLEKGDKLAVLRTNSFTEVYVPKIEKHCWLISYDVTRFVFEPEVHKQIFKEAIASFKQASTAAEKIDILKKQISLATDEIAAHPVIGLFYGDLFREYQKAGDSENAIRCLRKQIEMFALKGPDDHAYLQTKLELARLLTNEKQVAEAKQITTEVSNEVTRQLNDPTLDNKLVSALGNGATWFSVWPAGSAATPEQVSLMQKIVSIEPKGVYFNTLGVTLYRAGQFEQAIKACQQSIVKTPSERGLSEPHPADLAFTAMSHHQLHNEALSREFKEKAVAGAQVEPFKNDSEIIGIIKELQSLIPDLE